MPETANGLRIQLVANQSASFQRVKAGSLTSVGKNSAQHSYAHYGPGQLTPVQIMESYGTLILLYDNIEAKIKREFLCSVEFNNAVPAGFDFDQPAYDVMTKALQVADTALLKPDISTINLPTQGLLVNEPGVSFSW